MAVRTGTPHHSMKGMDRKAPPADTRPLMTPMSSPTPHRPIGPGRVRPGPGFLPIQICVAAPATITAKASANARCGIHPEASDDSSVPVAMGGARRLTTPQSTEPSLWCSRTLAEPVNSTPAIAVPSARCITCSGAICWAVNRAARMGTSVIPPPMPSSPAKKPMTVPARR